MLVAVFSDTHGNIDPAARAIRAWQPDMVLHLGDYVRDAAALQSLFPALDIRCVRGNCDRSGGGEPDKSQWEWEGVSVFMTHGHLYDVKFTMDKLRNAAWFSGAKLVLYGHTHCSEYVEEGGTIFLNPGSAGKPGVRSSRPTGALITLENGTVECHIRPLPEAES